MCNELKPIVKAKPLSKKLLDHLATIGRGRTIIMSSLCDWVVPSYRDFEVSHVSRIGGAGIIIDVFILNGNETGGFKTTATSGVSPARKGRRLACRTGSGRISVSFLTTFLVHLSVLSLVSLFYLSFFLERRCVAIPSICYAIGVSACLEVWIFCVWFWFFSWQGCRQPPPCPVMPGISTPAQLCW